jgi:hypothetical protein
VNDNPSGDMTSAFASALESASSTPVAEASPASTPEAAPIATEPSAPAATTQAVAETQTPESADTSQQDAKKEPPQWRWQDILENARTKAAEEAAARVRQEVEQQYAGLKDFANITPDERAGLLVWQRALSGDPIARQHIAQAAKADPHLARALQGLVAQEQAAADAEPEPDVEVPIRDQHGNVVGYEPMYSAKQQAKRDAWRERQLESKFQQQLQPFQNIAQTFQQREALAGYQTNVGTVIARMEAADPIFKEHKKDIWTALEADPKLLKMALEADPELALETAWGRVYRSKVLPAQKRDSEAQVLANLQQRAVASTVNPQSPSTATPKAFGRGGVDAFKAALEHHAGTGR